MASDEQLSQNLHSLRGASQVELIEAHAVSMLQESDATAISVNPLIHVLEKAGAIKARMVESASKQDERAKLERANPVVKWMHRHSQPIPEVGVLYGFNSQGNIDTRAVRVVSRFILEHEYVEPEGTEQQGWQLRVYGNAPLHLPGPPSPEDVRATDFTGSPVDVFRVAQYKHTGLSVSDLRYRLYPDKQEIWNFDERADFEHIQIQPDPENIIMGHPVVRDIHSEISFVLGAAETDLGL